MRDSLVWKSAKSVLNDNAFFVAVVIVQAFIYDTIREAKFTLAYLTEKVLVRLIGLFLSRCCSAMTLRQVNFCPLLSAGSADILSNKTYQFDCTAIIHEEAL